MIPLSGLLLRGAAIGLATLTLLALAAYVRRRRAVARAIGDPSLVRRLLGVDLTRVPWLRIVLVAVATIAIAVALLDPRHRPLPRGGAPLIFVLDASGSMRVADVAPDRLERQRQLARSLAAALPDVPIGIVAFAGRAYSLTAPTIDRGAVEMYLAAIDPTIVTQAGSAMGPAIRQGVGLLGGSRGVRGGTLVLFSDGDETEDEAAVREATDLAGRAGVVVHTVGIGTGDGGPVPLIDLETGATGDWLRGGDGDPIVSRLNEPLLRSIADRTGGLYAAATDPLAVGRMRGAVVSPADATASAPAGTGIPAYVWLAGVALLLLLVDPIAGETKRREA